MADDAARILGGRYEVGELIGRGGMAEVHIGHDTRLGRTVAIKILRSDLARDPSFLARFRREAQAAASLNHPAIVAVYDTGEDVFTERGGVAHVPFIVMEYVEGHTVRDILNGGAAVPIEEAVDITTGVLSALEYSHHAGIVHRDIKPANVMLTPTGAVKVMDFGIARAMSDAAGTMTQTQAVIGTAQYLSPEQARGEGVDTRSDLYSTGCLLFELLTGRPPFVGDSPVAVAYQHAREEARPPSTYASDVPEALDRITMRALAKDRDARYSTAAEFRSDLETAMRGGRISAPALGALGAAGGAATQVIGAGSPPTQVVPPAGAWPTTGATSVTPAVAPPPVRSEPPRKGRGGLWVLLVLVALAAAAGIAFLLTQDRGEPVATTVVPPLAGAEQAVAEQQLQALELVPRPQLEASDEVAEGLVIATEPGSGEEVPIGSEVVLLVSQGPEAVTVPDLQSLTQARAREELERAGFDPANITIDTEDSPTEAEDRVTRTDPAAGEQVPPDSPVTIFLSTGQVQLPDVTTLPQAQAEEQLIALGLVPSITTEETAEAAPGTVIRQGRSPGAVPQRSTVDLVVAAAPTVETVAVPDLVGLNPQQAQNALASAGLTGERAGEEPSATVPRDRATRTEPAAGQSVDEGSTVRVWFSSGPPATEDGEGDGDAGGGGEGNGNAGGGGEGNGNNAGGGGGNGNNAGGNGNGSGNAGGG